MDVFAKWRRQDEAFQNESSSHRRGIALSRWKICRSLLEKWGEEVFTTALGSVIYSENIWHSIPNRSSLTRTENQTEADFKVQLLKRKRDEMVGKCKLNCLHVEECPTLRRGWPFSEIEQPEAVLAITATLASSAPWAAQGARQMHASRESAEGMILKTSMSQCSSRGKA